MKVTLDTRTVGIHFATCGLLRAKSNGRVIAYCETDRPYGFVASALNDAQCLAERLGHTVVEAQK